MLPPHYEFDLAVNTDTGLGYKILRHAALLPHEVFSSIYSYAPELFERLFTGGNANLVAFWQHA
jgi:hypothetical protein